MMLFAEKEVRNRSRFLIFEPHDAVLRSEFIKVASGVMGQIVSNRGAYDFIVICDETINTNEVIDRNEFRARIGVQPTKAAEFIYITFTIHRTGSFEQSAIGNAPTRVR
jgi:phage tail sheath protein FI